RLGNASNAIKDKRTNRKNVFIEKCRSEEAAVEQTGCNSDFIPLPARRRSYNEDAANCRFCLNKRSGLPRAQLKTRRGRGGIRTHGEFPHARFRVECLKPDSATLPIGRHCRCYFTMRNCQARSEFAKPRHHASVKWR